MKDSRSNRRGDREIISVSLPVSLYDVLQKICEEQDINRSALITRAITTYLTNLGLKVGER